MPPVSAKIIVNPYAGRWKAREHVPAVRAAFERRKLPYDLTVTERPGEAIKIARSAVLAGYSPVVAVGGDGTYGEVVNGVMAAAGDGPSVPFGIIPLGTANDLAFALNIPQDVEQAVEIIARGHTRPIDVGRVNGRYFANNSAVGLEPVITLENARLVRVKGIVRYLLAALICIGRRPQWEMDLTWEDGAYRGSTVLVSVGNQRRTGGVFFMTPSAEPDDGQLDFVFAPNLSRLKLLRLLPLTFSGAHVQRPEVTEARCQNLTIRSRPGTPIQADGEVFELSAEEICYEVLPGRLTAIVPDGTTNPA